MKQSISFLGFIALMVIAWISMMGPQEASLGVAQQEVPALPSIRFLGEGAATFQIDPAHSFVIKFRRNEYKVEPGPTYDSKPGERVWEYDFVPDDEAILYSEELYLGPVTAGCVIQFAQIDDDVDDRLNYFYVNGAEVYEVPQGMVTYGSFVVPSDGELTFYANDSVGLSVRICWDKVTPTPSLTPTETATLTPTATATATITHTATITPSVTITPTVEATATGTLTPSPTATTVITPTATVTSTPTVEPPPGPNEGTPTPQLPYPAPSTATPTPAPTQENNPPRKNSCLRINFDIGGDVARRGTYVVQEVGGRVLATWWADEGWMDSGWVRDIDITFPSVYVQVFFVKGDGSEPVELTMLNPAPGTTYGWLTRGRCHALEVEWPAE